MNTRTIYREITAAGLLIASYPLDWLTQQVQPRAVEDRGEPVILSHGFGGGRSNLLGLGTYLRMAGFCNLWHFEYPRWQPLRDSVDKLSEMIEEADPEKRGVHLIGHSFGGLISRVYARRDPRRVKSLITLCSPYMYEQFDPAELAMFGDEDPIIPPPRQARFEAADSAARMIVLPATGHLGVLYHPRALELIEEELGANAHREFHSLN